MTGVYSIKHTSNPFANINTMAALNSNQSSNNTSKKGSTLNTPSTSNKIMYTSNSTTTTTNGSSPTRNSNIRHPVPLTFKSMTLPNFPSYKPQEQTFPKPKNVHLITAVELGKFLSEHNTDDYIIFDIRSFSEHSKEAIKSSIHVCLPSTLLRRKNFTFEKLVESLPFNEQQQILNKFKNPNLRIYLYDNNGHQTERSISQGCHGILVKLLNYAPCISPENQIKIGILSCGFPQFKNMFPDDITNPKTNDESLLMANTTQPKLDASSSTDSHHSPSILDNINLRLNVSDTNTSTSSNFLNSPSPQHTITDSPLSSSSPISALLKFQLPSQKTMPSQLFKFPQNEETMNLESYISAVNINEKQNRIQEHIEKKKYRNSLNLDREKFSEEDNEDSISLTSFQFPKRSASSCSNLSNDEKYKDKLTVQIKYSKLHSKYPQKDIDRNIPQWFQELMSRTKIQFASQFQKLDILEKRRLNSSISSMDTHSNQSSIVFSTEDLQKALPTCYSKPNSHSGSSCDSNTLHKPNNSDISFGMSIHSQLSSSPFSIKSPPLPPFSRPLVFKQTRSYSQPDCLISTNQKWINDIDTDLTNVDNDNEKIVISSGVELGSKNRYKDIFPYEHTRVRLKKHSLSSFSSTPFTHYNTLVNQEITKEKDMDIIDNYINANYITLPELDNSKELLMKAQTASQTILPSVSQKVRYIATQAPLRSTVHDFYSCIINDKVPLILSLTNDIENGVEKCFQYWKSNNYNGIKVNIIDEINPPELNKNVVIRRIRLFYDNDTKTYDVIQYQIKNWLDLSTLSDPIEIVHSICFKNILIKKLLKNHIIAPDITPTILVHCSAGCGRTGTWCTIDSILSNLENFDLFSYEFKEKNEATDKQYDPVAWTINMFRKQRISMVQNINQFLFIYDCLLYYFKFQLRDRSKMRFERSPNSLASVKSDIRKTAIIKRFAEGKLNEIETTA
ncbi:similar to Saccharomyces cerevisiae YER075C PTP3 Phosphotyrosine-specific protein phosphatase involved in the inactivation of mitogen-activated protein kinase (MAPK) during osmolarity sensing [Maudiozyma saulgeensis]|uniref:protein-tyrosine-phosphatase n=1 Tax=Maudiozyma saulgeensis TaxID=1789683 RepID=A0A1X7R2V6_9SACH|nr:similar to Saccharomyces cerevisiae YER075C PTP3 Phosphotyrosine-specific protein phosphatase involved in the inactivation of mitogen-activated protein kinase (MAPK) during osmolarity sensing [Kazachstania saulgeensis]